MSARIPTGGSDIDRSRPLGFTFDGQVVTGFAGDTIASALMASGVRVVGRSFKYHRPRGIWGAGVEEPNALVDIVEGGRRHTNVLATTAPARDGLEVHSVNATPDAAADRKAVLDLFARFLPAAFYYKTFMWPHWHLYEPAIRAMAGLGVVDPHGTAAEVADQINHHCDVLVVGAGPAGLARALEAVRAGRSVTLVDERPRAGGSLRHRTAHIDGRTGPEWVEATIEAIGAGGGLYLADTTAFGLYDHSLAGLSQRHPDGRPASLWRVRAGRIVLATGAIERPLPFANNDLPGVMSADAALRHLRCHAVLAGRRVVCATNNDSVREVAEALAGAGAEVMLVDSRASGPDVAGVRVLHGRSIASARGRRAVEAAVLDDGSRHPADCILVSGGWTPTVHLFSQAKGRLAWSEAHGAFLPGDAIEGIETTGAVAGVTDLRTILGPGFVVEAGGRSDDAPGAHRWEMPATGEAKRTWIDLQSDVTAADIALAARENFVSVEHLKRYTTLGMATDQGKTSNVNGLAVLAGTTGRQIADVGTTTFRPPYTPVPIAAFAGSQTGALYAPLRRLPLEDRHRALGARFGEYGGWLRPACYGAGEAAGVIGEEALRARHGVALFDGSPLGKIEVIGPQAADLVDFVQFAAMTTLRAGRCRYSFMLSEDGSVFDDGIVMRLDEHRFLVSCSSAHVAAVHARLEAWRQDRFDRAAVFIHDATASLATLTLSGPRAGELLDRLGPELPADRQPMPHMSVAEGRLAGVAVRIARVSFTGDRSYEVSVRADRAGVLWDAMMEAGRSMDIVPIGIEALMILRAEKGYIIAGKDTDGTTMPHDLGARLSASKADAPFVGRRSLSNEAATDTNRRQLVGLEVGAGEPPLATGAHGIEPAGANGRGGAVRSIGYVTSSYHSPVLGRPIALGLIERGAARHGETIGIQHLGQRREARIVPPCALDPAGARLDG